jgi:signal transduction histidine kinase
MAAGPEQVGRRFESSFLTGGRLVALVILTVAVVLEMRPGTSGAHLAVLVALVANFPAWLMWTLGAQDRQAGQLAALAVMSAAGGVMTPFAEAANVGVFVAALGAGVAFELPEAIAVSVLGPAAYLLAAAVAGHHLSLVAGPAVSAFIGLMLGIGRREYKEHAEQAAAMTVMRERAELERARAGVLDERNRLAREIHDVLAHTLGALTVQLEALDVMCDADPDNVEALREGLRRTRALASHGLVEARRAVRSLREDADPLEAQLAALCSNDRASLEVSGARHALSAEVTVALYRVAQEALTNATKHAPGAKVSVQLDFGDECVALAVANGPGSELPGALSASGAGYGLDGIRERVRLLKGEVLAGPTDEGGWLVEARLPA